MRNEAHTREKLMAALHRLGLRESKHQTKSPEQLLAMRGKPARRGINIGLCELNDLPDSDIKDTLR